MAYIANLFPTKTLINKKIIAENNTVLFLKFKNKKNIKPKIPKIPTHSFPSPITVLKYSKISSFWSSVIVWNVSGNFKTLVEISDGLKSKNSPIKEPILFVLFIT